MTVVPGTEEAEARGLFESTGSRIAWAAQQGSISKEKSLRSAFLFCLF